MATTRPSLQGLDLAKAQRLKQLQDSWAQFPGRAPGGSGLTGLNPNDAQGYSDMLNEQTEGLNLQNEMQGKAPVTVREGGDIPSQFHGIADDPDSSFNHATGPYGAFGVGTGGQSADIKTPASKLASLSQPMPETYADFMARTRKPKVK